MNLNKYLKKVNWYVVGIIFITVLLILTNYKPGSFLTGWDNLHPEFNWSLNLDRAIKGVWQEYQGLGLVAGMSHAADLSRQIVMLPLNFILPMELIRWVILWFTMLAGPIGMFYLSRDIFLQKKNQDIRNVGAFASAAFYLLNLGTMQNFYAPIEIFTYQFAFLPWLILFILKYINQPNYKKLLVILILSFFASPMAITSTLFLPYAILVSLIFAVNLFPIKRENTIKLAKLALVLIVANLYWALPTLYSAINKTDVVLNSKISNLVSDEVRAINERDSTFENFPLLKGFWFNNVDMIDESLNFDYMMPEWRDHTSNPVIYGLGVFLFVIVVLGIIVSFITKVPNKSVLLTAFIMGAIMLLGEKPPTGVIFNAIRNSADILNEIFRFPYTKFVIVTIFAFSGFFGIGIAWLYEIVDKLKIISKKSNGNLLICIIVLFPLILIMLPAFQGNFIYKRMKVEIPEEYFEAFDWFSSKTDNGRILHLPAHTYLGWTYYDWGYRGSGFLWYGIKQPIIDRAFDVWSTENEGAYLEFSNAIYTNDKVQFKNLLDKYDVRYVLLDSNIIPADRNTKSLYLEEIKDFLNDRETVFLSKQFGDISIYEYRESSNYIELVIDPLKLSTSNTWFYLDQIYNTYGNYVNDTERSLNTYPFDTMDERIALKSTIAQNTSEISLEYSNNTNNSINLDFDPKINANYLVPVRFQKDGNQLNITRILPSIKIGNKSVDFVDSTLQETIKINDDSARYVTVGDSNPIDLNEFEKEIIFINPESNSAIYGNEQNINLTSALADASLRDCSEVRGIKGVEYDSLYLNNVLQIKVKNGKACSFVPLANYVLAKDKYLVSLNYDFTTSNDTKPDICIRNATTTNCENVSNQKNSGPLLLDFSENEYWIEVFANDVDQNNNEFAEITYSNITLSIYEHLESAENEFRFNNLIPSIRELPANETLTIDLESYIKESEYSINEDLSVNRSREVAYDCGGDISVDSSVSTRRNVDTNGNFIEWEAVEASNCDYFSYNDLPHNIPYIIEFSGMNLEGAQLRLYLQNNTTRRNNVITDLDFTTGDVSKHYIYLAPSAENEQGYTFNIENRSIGTSLTKNRLYGIKIIPIDLNFINQLNLFQGQKENLNTRVRDIILGENSVNTKLTYVENLNDSESSFIFFNQSYSEGWAAYRYDSKPNFIQTLLPSIFGEKQANHVKANNWANAWEVSETGYYLIIFRPQLLEDFGLVILISSLVFLSYKAYTENNRKSRNIVYNDYVTSELIYR